jgi:hypothetical protein
MAKRSNMIGSWAFLIGVILAVGLGAMGTQITATLVGVLVVLGLIVGLLNISGDEAGNFLMAGAVLLIAANFGKDVVASVDMLKNILDALLILFVPATIIVAVKYAFSLAKN